MIAGKSDIPLTTEVSQVSLKRSLMGAMNNKNKKKSIRKIVKQMQLSQTTSQKCGVAMSTQIKRRNGSQDKKREGSATISAAISINQQQ